MTPTPNPTAEQIVAEAMVTDFAVSLKHATVAVSRASQQGQGGGFGSSAGVGTSGEGFVAQSADSGFGGGFDDPEPF